MEAAKPNLVKIPLLKPIERETTFIIDLDDEFSNSSENTIEKPGKKKKRTRGKSNMLKSIIEQNPKYIHPGARISSSTRKEKKYFKFEKAYEKYREFQPKQGKEPKISENCQSLIPEKGPDYIEMKRYGELQKEGLVWCPDILPEQDSNDY
jgi:hypothetical protein